MIPLDQDRIVKGHQCPYCGEDTELIDSAEIYSSGKSYGLAWICKPCESYVGCHQNTDKSKGRIANKDLRIWKMKAHQYFDPLWRWKMKRDKVSKRKARSKAYIWLARELKIDPKDCHIGHFDIYTCKRVVVICRKYKVPPS